MVDWIEEHIPEPVQIGATLGCWILMVLGGALLSPIILPILDLRWVWQEIF